MQTEFLIEDLKERNLLVTGDVDTGKSAILYDFTCRKLNEGKTVLVFSNNKAFQELSFFFNHQVLEDSANIPFNINDNLYLVDTNLLNDKNNSTSIEMILAEFATFAYKSGQKCYITIDDIELLNEDIYEFILEVTHTCKNLTIYTSTVEIDETKEFIVKGLFPAFFMLSRPTSGLALLPKNITDVNFNFNGINYAGCFALDNICYVIRYAFTDMTRREFGLKQRKLEMI